MCLTAGIGKKALAEKHNQELNAPRSSGAFVARKVPFDGCEPTGCKGMVEKMLASGPWKFYGRTPAATIYSALIRDKRAERAGRQLEKSGRGIVQGSSPVAIPP